MKLRQLQFVSAVARTRSFSAAADLCHATQPTLSTAVAQLEEELGGRIFDRTTRKVTPTAFGRHILPYLDAVLAAQSEAEAAAASYFDPQRKLVRIGISPLVDMRMVSMVTEPFRQDQPNVETLFKECLLDDLAQRIEAGGIDVAILPRDVIPDGLVRCAFYSDPMLYLPRGGVEAAGSGPMPVADVPDDPIIMTAGGCGLNRTLELLFEEEGAAPPAYPGYAISYPVIQEWCWLGLGAGVLPRAKVTGAGARPLLRRSGLPAEAAFCWAWHPEAPRIGHVREFLTFVRTVGPKLIAGRHAPRAV